MTREKDSRAGPVYKMLAEAIADWRQGSRRKQERLEKLLERLKLENELNDLWGEGDYHTLVVDKGGSIVDVQRRRSRLFHSSPSYDRSTIEH